MRDNLIRIDPGPLGTEFIKGMIIGQLLGQGMVFNTHCYKAAAKIAVARRTDRNFGLVVSCAACVTVYYTFTPDITSSYEVVRVGG